MKKRRTQTGTTWFFTATTWFHWFNKRNRLWYEWTITTRRGFALHTPWFIVAIGRKNIRGIM